MDSEDEKEAGLEGEEARKAGAEKRQKNLDNMQELLLLEEVDEATKHLTEQERDKEEEKMNEIIRTVGKENDIELPEVERKKQEINEKMGDMFKQKFKKKDGKEQASNLPLADPSNALGALQDQSNLIGSGTDKLVENIFSKELIKS